MSTRSYIGHIRPDGSIRYIFCHWNGYPEGNGKILNRFYKDTAKVESLLDLGSLDILGPHIGVKVEFEPTFDRSDAQDPDNPRYNRSQCVAHHRDGELPMEKCAAMEASNRLAFDRALQRRPDIQYAYLWNGIVWDVLRPDGVYDDRTGHLMEFSVTEEPLAVRLAMLEVQRAYHPRFPVRCYIGILNPGGKVEAVECRRGNDTEMVAGILARNYTDTPKVRKLLKLGNLEVLGPEIGHKVDMYEEWTLERQRDPVNPVWNGSQCIAYSRDCYDPRDKSMMRPEKAKVYPSRRKFALKCLHPDVLAFLWDTTKPVGQWLALTAVTEGHVWEGGYTDYVTTGYTQDTVAEMLAPVGETPESLAA